MSCDSLTKVLYIDYFELYNKTMCGRSVEPCIRLRPIYHISIFSPPADNESGVAEGSEVLVEDPRSIFGAALFVVPLRILHLVYGISAFP